MAHWFTRGIRGDQQYFCSAMARADGTAFRPTELFQNEYQRITSSRHILVRPTDFAGVLKGELTVT